MDADKIVTVVATLIGGIITLAIVATILSKRAQTSSVIQAASSGLASVIGAAVAPVTGGGGTGSGGLFGH